MPRAKSGTKQEEIELPRAQRVLWGVGLAVVVILVLNGPYFWKQLNFILSRNNHPAANTSQTKSSSELVALANMIWIDSLGVEAPIQYVDQADEKTFQAALINGVVHYPGTAMPGQLGNDYIFGHSSDYLWSKGHYKTAFALLPRIADGAEIKITDSKGQLYIYIVKKRLVVGPTDVQYLGQYNYQKKLLTVQTSYPIGTALKRYLVIAELKE